MKNVPHIAHALQEVLGEIASRAGRESGFIQRQVKLTGASFVQTLVFTWLANPAASYEELAQTAATLGVLITPQGIEQRFTRAAANFLKLVLEEALARVFRSQPCALPLLERFTEMYLQDSTVIGLPESLKDLWAGCGGDASSAALKRQVRWAVRSGALEGLFLTAGRANDPSSPNRPFVARFLDAWRPVAEDLPPQAAALALLTAAQCEKERREELSIEPVWTGPDVGGLPLRRTEQSLLDLLDSAAERILIVSYAVYNIPRIGQALIRATDRGVAVTLILETPDRIVGEHAYNTLRALGDSVARRCALYFWPLEQRPTDPQGKPGLLHVKCAIADGRRLFLSSANLTEYAFTLNLELGLLLSGGSLPHQIEAHFRRMIDAGVFAKV